MRCLPPRSRTPLGLRLCRVCRSLGSDRRSGNQGTIAQPGIIDCCFTYNAGRAPLLEVGHLSVPGTVLGAFLANPKGLSAKMIFTVQLIGVVIIISVSEQVHSRSSDTINLFYELKGTTALYLP